MAQMNRRSARRRRHADNEGPQQFASMGEERDRPPGQDPARDPKTLSDFEPGYGKTYSAEAQPRGGQAPYERQTYGNQGTSDAPDEGTGATTQQGAGVSGFGREYGQGFGVGAGHGVDEPVGGGTPREREYRGDAGTTYGAVVGPDALKEDTRQDKRPDDKPEKS